MTQSYAVRFPGAYIDPTANIAPGAVCQAGCWIGPDVTIAAGCVIGPGAVIGFDGQGDGFGGVRLGENVRVGPQVVIQPNVRAEPDCVIEPFSMIGSGTTLGRGVHIGVRCTVKSFVRIGDYANLESEVHVARHSTLEHHCQLMPGAILVDDAYPPTAMDPQGPVIGPCAVVGVKSIIYPGIHLGYHAMVGAMSIVKKDVPDYTLVSGSPAAPVCDVRRIRTKIKHQWVYPYPWMRCQIPGEDITKPADIPK